MARTKQQELFEDIFDCLSNNSGRYVTSRDEFDKKYEDFEFEIDYTHHTITFTDEDGELLLTLRMEY